MPKTHVTADTITEEQVRTLRDEAASAGDSITVGLCDNALRYWGGRASITPKRMLAECINYAAAQER